MFPYVEKSDANTTMAETVMPAPAHTGLNPDDKG
jgi:hypothetical protein